MGFNSGFKGLMLPEMNQDLKGRRSADVAEIQRESLAAFFPAFLLKILDHVSSSGSGAGIAGPSHRGNTLKGNNVLKLYEYFK